MSRRFSILALCVALAAGTGGANAAQPTPVPDVKPDFGSMSFLLGTWECHGTIRGTARPDTVTYTMDYEGRWMKGHDVAPVFDKYRTRAVVTDTWMNYNPVMREWVQTSVDNFGGYGIATAPGWSGNRIVWTTTVSQDGTTGKDVFTKLSDSKTKDVFTGKSSSGQMQAPQTTVCTKSHAAM